MDRTYLVDKLKAKFGDKLFINEYHNRRSMIIVKSKDKKHLLADICVATITGKIAIMPCRAALESDMYSNTSYTTDSKAFYGRIDLMISSHEQYLSDVAASEKRDQDSLDEHKRIISEKYSEYTDSLEATSHGVYYVFEGASYHLNLSTSTINIFPHALVHVSDNLDVPIHLFHNFIKEVKLYTLLEGG